MAAGQKYQITLLLVTDQLKDTSENYNYFTKEN